MSEKEIVLVTGREQYVTMGKTKDIQLFSGGTKKVIELPKGEFQNLSFSGYRRPECEKNYNFIQMIPYIVLRDLDEETGEVSYLTYRRGKKGAEDRLHDKFSVGIGGHVSINQYVDPMLASDHVYIKHDAEPVNIVIDELIKEIEEEVNIDILDLLPRGNLTRLVLDATPFYVDEGPDSVNSYHFALPIAINVCNIRHHIKNNVQDGIETMSFMTVPELKELAALGVLETWTDIVLNNFIPRVITPEYFESATGRAPVNDDVERANCSIAGAFTHSQCGWCEELNLPNTQVSTIK